MAEMPEEWMQEMREGLMDWENHLRKQAIKSLFKRKRIDSSIADYNYFIRLFCWIKALICLLCKWTGGCYLDADKFTIVNYNHEQAYEGMNWTSCWVSPYVFKDWNVCIGSDGSY